MVTFGCPGQADVVKADIFLNTAMLKASSWSCETLQHYHQPLYVLYNDR